MITGAQFPKDLIEDQYSSKALPIYRTYLERKALEEKTPYVSLIIPSAIGGLVGSVVGAKTGNKMLPYIGAAAPALIGYGLKTLDDNQIEKAKFLQHLDDDTLTQELARQVRIIQERSPRMKVLTGQEPLTVKIAAAKSVKDAAKGIAALSVIGGLTGAYLLNKDKLKAKDVIAEAKKRPVIYPKYLDTPAPHVQDNKNL